MYFKVVNFMFVGFLCCGCKSIFGIEPAEINHQNLVRSDSFSNYDEFSTSEIDDGDGIWIRHKRDLHGISSTAASNASTVTSTPAPDANLKGDWCVNYTGTQSKCIRLVAEIKLELKQLNKTSNDTITKEFIFPKNATVSGSCDHMVLNYTKSKDIHVLSMGFSVDNATKIWRLANISAFVKMNKDRVEFNKTADFLNAPIGMSYLCSGDNPYSFDLGNSTSYKEAILKFSQLQIEAYKPTTSDSSVFGSPKNCEVTPDMVPIAVGCALAGLVVVVLVAYLIAQRRPPAQGYRSV